MDGYDADSLLTPLPAVLGRKQLVEGVNDTEDNVGRTSTVLVGTAREFITLELYKRGGGHAEAPVVKHLAALTDQARLDLLPWEVQAHMLTFRAGQYLIARIIFNLVERIIAPFPLYCSPVHIKPRDIYIPNGTNQTTSPACTLLHKTCTFLTDDEDESVLNDIKSC